MNKNMLSTTDTIKNCIILEQKGIVSARAVVGVGFFSEFFAGLLIFSEDVPKSLRKDSVNFIYKRLKILKRNCKTADVTGR